MIPRQRSILPTLPGAIVAVSWSGFWLYLGVLDLLGIETRSALTAAFDVAIALGLAVTIWLRRATLVRRLRASTTIARIWLVTALAFAALFAYGVLVTGHGPLAHRLLGVFAISTIPTVIALAGFSLQDLRYLRAGLVVLGIAFLVINLVASRHGAQPGGRFSPIAHLDPISASLVSVIGCLAAFTYQAHRGMERVAQAAVCFLLAAGSMLNGARGPIVALSVAALVLVVRNRRLITVVAALAIATGIVSGSKLEAIVIGQLVPARTNTQSASSFHIRHEWISSSLHQVRRRPILGNGIGTLVDETPEAKAMGVEGQLVYPHNDAVESVYSLGVVGGVLYAVLIGIPIVVLWRRRSGVDKSLGHFITAVFIFAFIESNFSGELGTDLMLWSVAAFTVVAFDQAGLGFSA
jgi:hypothetical protein